MRLSIIVGLYNMQREITRTLTTMSAAYQGVDPGEYEILLVDNGSAARLVESELREIAGNVRYRYIEDAQRSPTNAINAAADESRGELITVVIDGARMFSPGILRRKLQAFELFDDPFVYAPSLHLGPQLQNDSSYGGYDQSEEDALLATVPWEVDGHQLFSISNIDVVPERLVLPTFESNCFTIRRSTWDRLGGYHPGFGDSVAGGVANWELFARYLNAPEIQPVVLVGEATFHQFHGGASTNQPRAGHPIRHWLEEHERIVGGHYAWPQYEPFLFGETRSELRTAVFETNVKVRIAVALELSHAGEHGAAIALARLLSEGHPNDPGKLQVLAEVLERSSRRAQALETIDRALVIAPTQAELHITRGVIQVGLAQLDAARSSYDKAIEIDARLPEAYFHRGHLGWREGRLGDAVRDFECALVLEPDPPQHYQADLERARRSLEVDGVAAGANSAPVGAPRQSAIDTLRAAFFDSVQRHYGSGEAKRFSEALLPAFVREHDLKARIARIFNTYGQVDEIHRHALEGSLSNAQLAMLCALVADQAPARLLIVGGFLGLSTAALVEATATAGSSLVTIDPNVRHRMFSAPLDHARSFISSNRVDFIDGFFAERTDGGTLFDLSEFQPKIAEEQARNVVDQIPVVLPAADFDFVLIDADPGSELTMVTAALRLVAPAATLVVAGHHPAIANLAIAAGLPAEFELLTSVDGTRLTVVRIEQGSN